MERMDIALVIGLLTLVTTIIFIGYALTGSDLCLWCVRARSVVQLDLLG